MIEKIKRLTEEVRDFTTDDYDELEEFRIEYLGKKGIIPALFAEIKNLPVDAKKEIGIFMNTLKNAVQEKIDFISSELEDNYEDNEDKPQDLSMPVDFIDIGARHPLSVVRNSIIEIFTRIGFNISYGPEIEDDWHNFTALNFPQEHPARDMQDTFFIAKNPDIALRTHTSSVQVRVMENNKPPIRTISPGRVFRNEAISARSHCLFHQIEGLYIDKDVSFAELKKTLLYFAQEFFGADTNIRLRPSYFPFTEPSAEMDISCKICGGKGCNICKYSGWVEILGCGMVDPNVLDNCNIDSKIYTGYAFGMGIERIAMLKYLVKDIRLFYENDLRFLKQFEGAF